MTVSRGLWYNGDSMTPLDTHRVPLPEAGSTNGVHLRGGSLRGASVPGPPAAFTRGALYSIYPRAFSSPGTLAAVIPQLDRIAALGACAIWLLPIHPVGMAGRKGSAGCPYAVRDYRAVDPALGTAADLRALTEAAHDRGLRVIIDFVANHAANDHHLAGEHPDWFTRDAGGAPTRRVSGWSDVADWNFAAAGVTDYLAESAAYWVRETGIDGFRCDVAGMVPRPFWIEVRRQLTEAQPDHFLLAEWLDPELHTVAFHASYDWLLYRALRDTASGRVGASRVGAALAAWNENFPPGAIPLRFLENHDEPRATALFGLERIPAYAAVAFLSGGMPLLYNGQEVGASHRPSLFERDLIDWSRPDERLETLYRDLIRLQREEDPWGPGAAIPVDTDRPATVTAFTREGGGRRGLVVANLGRDAETVRVNAQAAPGRYRRVHAGAPGSVADTRVPGRAADTHEPGGSLRLDPGEAWVGVS
jgi:glycosidase